MKNEEAVREIITYYAGQRDPACQENLTSMLREIQEAEGWIPMEAREMAAERLGVKPGVLSCIIRLYPDLKEAPYAHEILICTGERCQNRDSRHLLDICSVGGWEMKALLKKELCPDKKGLSKDRKILLITRNCLKQCRTSPNLKIDGKLYPAMTEEKLKSLLAQLQS